MDGNLWGSLKTPRPGLNRVKTFNLVQYSYCPEILGLEQKNLLTTGYQFTIPNLTFVIFLFISNFISFKSFRQKINDNTS